MADGPAPGRILDNPYDKRCPDYTTDGYQAVRDIILAALPDVDPVTHLQDIWTAENTREKAAWDAQEEADRILRQQQQQQQQQPQGEPQPGPQPQPQLAQADQLHAAVAQQLPATSGLDIKIAKGKAIDSVTSTACPYARERLKNYKYIDIWYFSEEGIRLTTTTRGTAGCEGLGIVPSADGIQLRPTHDLKPSKFAIADEYLDWPTISQARHLFLQLIAELGWRPDIIQMFHEFFYKLDGHELGQTGSSGRATLAQYEATVRRKWHDLVERRQETFDLAEISATVMYQCERIVTKRIELARDQKEVERDTQVCFT
ncbi:hypothetical protein EIP91_010322 [Steccherinum ochraceum]|uniref:Uncharacterized protein n=1 Tax=Steccherinum ochraceum TaxID=92696 RepID=A0A4R0RD02_9APHY|nr:hypothetical protein EIP91_010322 [Steccherinum ochraceum]